MRTRMDASASYEIGSVTKQLTAAAVLPLAEEGLIDLDADLTDYVDFDTRGRTVPVRRLLDHTSGITAADFAGTPDGPATTSCPTPGAKTAARPSLRVDVGGGHHVLRRVGG